MKNDINNSDLLYKGMNEYLNGIQNAAIRLGSTREAIRGFMEARADKLPEGIAVDDAVNSIIDIATEFSRVEHATIEGDFELNYELGKAVKDMTSEEAYRYLATVYVMLAACNAAAAGDNASIPTYEELEAEIKGMVSGYLERGKSIEQCIDEMIDEISDNTLNMEGFVYAAGNEALTEALKNISPDRIGAGVDSGLMSDSFSDADRYAMAAAACYGQVLDGKAEGIEAEAVEPHLLTAIVSTGVSKGMALCKLADEDFNMGAVAQLIGATESAFRWVFIKSVQLLAAGASAFVFYHAIVYLTGASVLGGGPLLFKAFCEWGIIIAVLLVLAAGKGAEILADRLIELRRKLDSVPVKIGNKAMELIKRLFKVNDDTSVGENNNCYEENGAVGQESSMLTEGNFA